MVELKLTADEKKAKDFMLRFLTEGKTIECDETSDFKLQLPEWYDEAKFKRGQKYFKENRFGISNSNLFGLLALISDPNGLNILVSTGRSSTPETARKRYVQTTLHLFSWYEHELKPGSESWKSLEQVRKMHYLASKQAKAKGLGPIAQMEVAITAYGFMGFAITRPEFVGVAYDNREDHEAFVFFWAVICSLLGVRDEYNICFHSLEVVKLICELFRRYMAFPSSFLETPTFIQMSRAFYDGQKQFLISLNYESMIFLYKRLIGVPGFQYDCDVSKEHFLRNLFTDEEMKTVQDFYLKDEKFQYVRDLVFDNKFHLVEIRKSKENNNNNTTEDLPALNKLMGLKPSDELIVTDIDEADWAFYMNDSEYYKLSQESQTCVDTIIKATRNNYTWWGHYVHDWVVSYMIRKIQPYK